jgi:SagB-type dehydrogenase family enzyme
MNATMRFAAVLVLCLSTTTDGSTMPREDARVIPLPDPRQDSEVSVEAAMMARKSVREYSGGPLTLAEVSQLLWAAQGVTHGGNRRTAPSAGALYPLEIYVVASNVEGLEKGVYKYRIGEHELVEVATEDLQGALAAAALSQECIADAAAVFVIAGVVERTAAKYGQRAARYVHMEVGSAAQNIYLQSAALGLGTVFVGAFSDSRVKQVLGMADEESPFALMPVGNI